MSFTVDRAFVELYPLRVFAARWLQITAPFRRQRYADSRMAEIDFWDAVERSMIWHARQA